MIRSRDCLLAAALMAACLVPPANAQSVEEKSEIWELLHQTKERFLGLMEGLDEEQWTYKAARFAHTIGQEAEHVALAHRDLQRTIHFAIQSGKKPELAEKLKGREEDIKKKLLDPAKLSEAYNPPNRLQTKAEVVDYFGKSHDRLLDLLQNPELNQYIFEHPQPNIGALTGYQWLYYIAYHAQKHCDQIELIMREDGFPGKVEKTESVQPGPRASHQAD